jgi:molecular chaperone GrpE
MKERPNMKKHVETKHDPEPKSAENTAKADAKAENNAEKSREEQLESQVSELNDKFLRLYSEFDNYRKRTIKEKIEQSKSASADVIIKLLPVLDDFERAIKAFGNAGDGNQAIKDGIILIFNKFLSILNQEGLEQMRSVGEPFDTDFHEAITNIETADPGMKGKIIDEIEKGYLLGGKVIRYAKVVVGN